MCAGTSRSSGAGERGSVLVLNRANTQDAFAPALTLQLPNGFQIVGVAANNSIDVALAPISHTGTEQDIDYTNVLTYPPGPLDFQQCSGIAVRSTVPGSPAVVTLALLQPGDPVPAFGSQFVGTIAASGAYVPSATGAMQVIQDQLLTVSATSVTFANIPQTFAHLRLEICAREDGAVVTDEIFNLFNGDIGVDYEWIRTLSTPSTVTPSGGTGVNNPRLCLITGASLGAGRFASSVVDFPNYASSNTAKTWRGISMASAGAGGLLGDYCGTWLNTSPLVQIALAPGTGNFVAGSRFTLYGLTSS